MRAGNLRCPAEKREIREALHLLREEESAGNMQEAGRLIRPKRQESFPGFQGDMRTLALKGRNRTEGTVILQESPAVNLPDLRR